MLSDGAIAYVPGRATAVLPDALVVPVGVQEGVDAVDVTTLAPEKLNELLGDEVKWTLCRPLLSSGKVDLDEVSAIARAVSLLTWHKENAFSGIDGSPTEYAQEGRRRKQPSSAGGRTMYPRVDPVAICLVESCDGSRCLMGRQKNYPQGMYTLVSGFVEHGESVEMASVREVKEETGVICGPASLVASQPWPLGRGHHCELMLACIARAVEGGEAIDVSSDGGAAGELEDARWFERAEVTEMLARTSAAQGAWTPPAFAIAVHLRPPVVPSLLARPWPRPLGSRDDALRACRIYSIKSYGGGQKDRLVDDSDTI